MNSSFCRLLAALFVFAFASFIRAGDFKSAIIHVSDFPPLTINVPDDRFLVIRNFTQQGPSTASRGLVTVTNLNGVSMNVDILIAAIIRPSASPPPEVINNVVVAGPATVAVTCPDPAATCFITYRKGSD